MDQVEHLGAQLRENIDCDGLSRLEIAGGMEMGLGLGATTERQAHVS